MATCNNCGKGKVYGSTQRHRRGVAGGQWLKRAQKTPKVFKPNLHHAWIVRNGRRVRVALCTKCLRKVRAEQKNSKTTKFKSTPQVMSAS